MPPKRVTKKQQGESSCTRSGGWNPHIKDVFSDDECPSENDEDLFTSPRSELSEIDEQETHNPEDENVEGKGKDKVQDPPSEGKGKRGQDPTF